MCGNVNLCSQLGNCLEEEEEEEEEEEKEDEEEDEKKKKKKKKKKERKITSKTIYTNSRSTAPGGCYW